MQICERYRMARRWIQDQFAQTALPPRTKTEDMQAVYKSPRFDGAENFVPPHWLAIVFPAENHVLMRQTSNLGRLGRAIMGHRAG
jgi:hypothetical protein